MATWVKRSCAGCGTEFERGMAYRSLGQPWVTCWHCGADVLLNHVNEWEFMTRSERAVHLATCVFTCCLYGIVPGGMVGFGIGHLLLGLDEGTTPLIMASLVGAMIGVAIAARMAVREIKASQERTAEPWYRAALERRLDPNRALDIESSLQLLMFLLLFISLIGSVLILRRYGP